MAIVAHTPYVGSLDCERTNEYVTDGHGRAVLRTNRYLSDGHGKTQLIGAYNCPADPALATEFMKTLRINYERQHPVGPNRTIHAVTHQQIYVSPTEEDNVPAEERMVMMRELIERTPLRDFASIYVPHDNTPDKHGHISLCPYSVPDEAGRTHKLCMNNTLLNTLRREMDYICVEHGYSIVENSELWGDKIYRDWFFDIKEKGLVKIHPPRECDRTTYKQDRKRSRSYAASKQSQALSQEKQAEFYKFMTRSYNDETAEFFYTPVHLYNPGNPNQALHIRKYGKQGKELSELEQSAVALFVWAYQAEKTLEKRNVPGSTNLKKRMQSMKSKAFTVKDFLHVMDIRTHAELISHIKECGSDISELKQDVARQDTIISRMADIMDAIDRWENQLDANAYDWLKNHHCSTAEEISDAKKRYTRAIARKATNERLLEERKTEYRHLKETESLLHPASTKEEWHAYLETIFGKEIEKKLGYIDDEVLKKQLYQTGKIAGLLPEDVDRIFDAAKDKMENSVEKDFRSFMRIACTYDRNGAIASIYDDIRDHYEEIRSLRELVDDVVIVGPLTFLLALAVAIYAGGQEAVLLKEIEILKWEAELQKEYAKETRRTRIKALNDAKSIYDAETATVSEQEITATKNRFCETAMEIVGWADIFPGLEYTQVLETLDQKIETASQKKAGSKEKQRALKIFAK